MAGGPLGFHFLACQRRDSDAVVYKVTANTEAQGYGLSLLLYVNYLEDLSLGLRFCAALSLLFV